MAQCRKNADILFVESGYIGLESVGKLRAVRRTSGAEVYLFSESDWPFALVPGLYCSLTKRLPWARSWAFVLDDANFVNGEGVARRYLFSFIGRLSTHPIRERIRLLDGPHTPCLDTSNGLQRFGYWDYRRTFSRVLTESDFVLCPRGIGSSSMRVFETMRAGRVPVIISDDWIEPPCGSWARFSIRVPELDIERIPEICERHRHQAATMGALARRTFVEYFSPAAFFDSALDTIRLFARDPKMGPINILRAISSREIKTVAHRLRRAKFYPPFGTTKSD